jgi:hypothetical protein
MDIVFCNEKCPMGIKAKEKFLNENNSAFDAFIDFENFISKCILACEYKDKE